MARKQQDPELSTIHNLITHHQAIQTTESPFNPERENLIQSLVTAHLQLQKILRQGREQKHAA